MEMEMEGEDGSKLAIGPKETVFGRGCGLNTNDRTVSRRHVCFKVEKAESEGEGGSSSSSSSGRRGSRVSFEVIGRNPVWVWSHSVLKLFRKFEKGHLEFGDRFSLSAKTPVWFHLNDNNLSHSHEAPVAVPDIEASSPTVDLDIDKIDLSQIDPVKEFGFLVMGHEFDQYPKGKIRDVKDWEWFLDEPSKDSDEEDEGKKRRKMKRKWKRGKDNEDDEEWGGESEDDKDIVAKIRKGKRSGYSTRSKDSEKGPSRGTKGASTSSKQKKTTVEDDEDDETLGGFIVDDEEDDKEENVEKEEEEDEEEEEFEDDDED